MSGLVAVLELVVVVAVTAGLARRFDVSEPIALVLVGVALSFVPGVPTFQLDPEVVLVLILPPLLYAAAINTSLPAFRANLRPIALLSVGLVAFSALAIAVVASAVIPGLPLAAAFALGAIVAPPDAVAATSVARRVGLPRRVVTVLEGESLMNDATALVIYRVAVGAALTAVSPWEVAGQFVLASVGGLAVGLAVAWLVGQVRRRLEDSLLDNTLSLVTPFLAYLPAEQIHASGVLAVVVTGLYLGYRGPVLMSPASRLQAKAIWRMIEFLLQGVVFALIGLQLRGILAAVARYPLGTVALAAVAVTAGVVIARFVWVFPATYLPRMLIRRVRERDPYPPWQIPAVISWAGMRGVVSLAAALALPSGADGSAAFPYRDLIVFLTFVVIIATLVVQGFTLPAVVRRLGLTPPDPRELHLQEAGAQHAAADAALRRLERLINDSTPPPDGVLDQLRDNAEKRRLFAWERLGGRGEDRAETPSSAYRRLRRAMLDAEREVFVRLRDEGRLDDEVLRRLQHELDLEDVLLSRD